MSKLNENAIKEAAYFMWQNAGCPAGNDEYFWTLAVEQYSNCNKKSACKSSSNSCSSAKKATTKTAAKTSSTAKKTTSAKSSSSKK